MKTVALWTLTFLSLLGSSFAAIAADSGKARNVRQFLPGVPTTMDSFGNPQYPGMDGPGQPMDAYGNPAGAHVDAYGNPVAMPPRPQQIIVQQTEQKSPYGGGAHGALGGLFSVFFG